MVLAKIELKSYNLQIIMNFNKLEVEKIKEGFELGKSDAQSRYAYLTADVLMHHLCLINPIIAPMSFGYQLGYINVVNYPNYDLWELLNIHKLIKDSTEH